MLQTILLTALSSALLFKSPTQPTQASTPQVVFTQVLPEENYVSYTVEKNDTLKSIAFAYYGSQDYWTTVLQDNPQIADSSNLKDGSLLKIRVEKPANPAAEDAQQTQDAVPTDEPTPTAENTPVPSLMPTPTPFAEPTATQAPVVSNPSGISDAAIAYLGNCEAGMNPTRNSGNGYYGAFQFSYGTWKSMNTGYERADLAPIDVQIAAVKQLLSRSSIYNQFPGCASKMRSEGII